MISFAAYLLAYELYEGFVCMRNLRRHRSDECRTWLRRLAAYMRTLNDRYAWLGHLASVLSLIACALLVGSSDPRATRETQIVSVLLAISVLCSWAIVAAELFSWTRTRCYSHRYRQCRASLHRIGDVTHRACRHVIYRYTY